MGVVSWSDERAREEEVYAFGVLACLRARPFVQYEHRSIGTTTDGPFILTMRLYGARAPILTGDYRLRAVERAT